MLKFEHPHGTRTGEKATKIWNELKACWRTYRTARIHEDIPKMREYAKKIRELQGDLGIKQAEFPELKLNKSVEV